MEQPRKPVKIRAKVMWSFHNKLNDLSERYQIDLCDLSDGAVKALEQELNLEVKNNPDKPDHGNYIICKSIMPLKILDSEGNSLQDVAIGNGSTGVAIVSSYDWQNKGGKIKSGTSATLNKMVIDNLQVYEKASDYDEDDGDVL